jgi:hypothetical protein
LYSEPVSGHRVELIEIQILTAFDDKKKAHALTCAGCLKNHGQMKRKAKRIYNSQSAVLPSLQRKFEQRHEQLKLKQAWGSYAESFIVDRACQDLFSQAWFGTLTTQYSMTLPSARRAVERFQNVVKRKMNTCSICWFAEKHETRDAYHLHLLVASNATRDELNDAWRVASRPTKDHALKIAHENNIVVTDAIFASDNEPHLRQVMQSRSHFAIYKKGAGGGGYAAKYISKQGYTTDYDILP